VGESTIHHVEFLLASEILEKYPMNIFLSQTELTKYVGTRKDKKMLVLHLKKIRKYEDPINSDYKISMSGQHLSKNEYKKIFE
jgi:hypothetical protein